MKYDRPISELVRARRSVRTYTGGPIEPGTMKRLEDACASANAGVFGEGARFTVVEKPFSKDQPVGLGDYGLQKNPRYFILGAIKNGDRARESFGHLLEQLVLKSTELCLGTCWMGLFNREFFAGFQSSDDELVPAIAVVGVPAERPRLGERIIRFGIGANSRKDWKDLFFLAGFDRALGQEDAGPYAEPLEMLRLGPSAGNAQPWRVVKELGGDVFHFYLTKVKENYYKLGLHNIDIGIAMAHFELPARERGLSGGWMVVDPRLAPPAGTEYRVSWLGK